MASVVLPWLADAGYTIWCLAIAAILAMGFAGYGYLRRSSSPTIPSISGRIPRLSVTLMYMTDMRTFLSKAKNALRERHIIQFYLGPMKVYLVNGANNVQAMFRASNKVSSDIFFLMVQEHIWNSTSEDFAKFANDKTGRLKLPANPFPDAEKAEKMSVVPEQKRYWATMHETFHRYLNRTDESNALARSYQRFFGQRLDSKFPLDGTKVTVRIYQFLLQDMAESAVTAINGSRILELKPDIMKLVWDFDVIAASLVWGLPKFLNRESWRKRDRLIAATRRYLEVALNEFDWSQGAEGEEDPDWEPIFGSRLTRELVRWMKESGFAMQTMAGALTNFTLFGGNSNTIPVTTWCIMHIARSPDLLEEVRKEVMTAYETSPTSTDQQRIINAQTLLSLPLLQSIYTEGLRLHVSMNVTRQVTGPLELGGVTLEKGAILQAATEISHYDEETWGMEGHPASEFWAERHVQYVDEVGDDGKTKRARRFVLAGGPNDFFPYGGGVSICPGRFFAKQEIILTIAMLVSRFDIEFIGWVNHPDGTPSERPAQNDVRWSGGAAVPPDRDMQVLFKRLW